MKRCGITVLVLLAVAGVAGSGLAEGTNAVSPDAKSKFTTPVSDPSARWEREVEPWAAASGQVGNLDGPRREIMWRRGSPAFPFAVEGGPHWLWYYDSNSERIHTMTAGARGSVDGPFNRARWTGTGYSMAGIIDRSPDGRFLLAAEPYIWKGPIRVFDLKEQMVRSMTLPAGFMVFDSKGQLWNIFTKDGKIQQVDLTTVKVVSERVVEGLKGADLAGNLALDEVHNRIYCSGTATAKHKWRVWYYDLNDNGSFHGVLSGAITGPGMSYCGPFDGYKGYPDVHVEFGPDDPERRYLYMNSTDTANFMRLDLEKQMVAAFTFDSKSRQGWFIESGAPQDMGVSHLKASWLPNGDFIMPGVRSAPTMSYKRVK